MEEEEEEDEGLFEFIANAIEREFMRRAHVLRYINKHARRITSSGNR
jgi:hypothetical protein